MVRGHFFVLNHFVFFCKIKKMGENRKREETVGGRNDGETTRCSFPIENISIEQFDEGIQGKCYTV